MSAEPAPPRRERDAFEERLRAALRLEVQRTAFPVDRTRLHAATTAPRPRRRPQWLPVAGVLSAVAIAVVGLALVGAGRTAGPAGTATAAVAAGSATTAGGGAGTDPAAAGDASAPIGLADCRIEPADARLAFSGWATTDALRVTGGSADPGQPVYAVVTRGLAEWMGWRDSGSDPIFPQPVGRMGCIYDPSTGVVSQVGVPMDWQPPQTVDGCPASTEDEYAGYREIGGPRAWALLPTGTSWWISDRRFLILYRLSPPLANGERLTGWAQPLDGSGARVTADLRSVAVSVASGDATQPADPASPRYYIVEVGFSTPGCWVLDVAVNGRLAGSAIIPVVVVPGAEAGRAQLSVP